MTNTLRKLLLLALASSAIILALPRCASTGTISGGDKDTIPPVLLMSTPKMYQTGFTEKVIKLTFNEYIALRDPAKQFFVSPPLEVKAFPMPKGRSVVVKLENLLAANTTYTVGFGNSIVDNNEGNPIKDLQLVFSTGSRLDTLAVEGYLFDAYTQKVPENVKVMLYKEENDSLPYLSAPNYYAFPETSGFFRVPNLPAGKYKLVAVADKNDNLRYEQNAELVGFSSSPIQAQVKQPIDTINRSTGSTKLPEVRLFLEESVNLTLLESSRPKADIVKLVFTKPNPELPKITIPGYGVNDYITESSKNKDTVLFWITNPDIIKNDTIKAMVTYLKTGKDRLLEYKSEALELYYKAQVEPKPTSKKPTKSAAFNPTFMGITDGVVPATGAVLGFSSPPVGMDQTKFSLSAKSETDSTTQPFTIEKTNKPLFYSLNVSWKEGSTYFYKILPGAFTSAMGLVNDTIVGRINVAKKEEFGTIVFKVTNLVNPVILQLLTSTGGLYKEFPLKNSTTLTVDYIPASSYMVRIIYDDNGNQQWDSGNLVKRIQPEMVKIYKQAGDKGIFVVKKNWENELEIDLTKILNQ